MQTILVLGGTTEARQLVEALALRDDCAVTLSLAGRTRSPSHVPVPVRTGGFGGSEGLALWLRDTQTDLMVDATHPFAARISAHAADAAGIAGIRAFALRRPPWRKQAGDIWIEVPEMAFALTALGRAPRRVLLALGRQEAHIAQSAPQHHYLVRSIEPIDPPLALPDVQTRLARGPFTLEAELALLRQARIDAVVSKNSGGRATYAKIAAARILGIEVVLVHPPAPSSLHHVEAVADALRIIDHREMLRGA